MTIIAHTVICGYVSYTLTGNLAISYTRGLLSSLPDLIGWIGLVFNKNWGWYHHWHNSWWGWILFPEHKVIDKLTHLETGGWKSWTWIAETLACCLMVLIVMNFDIPEMFKYATTIWVLVVVGIMIKEIVNG